jgi:peptidyl-prolyl cis-trans isomerase D
MLKTFRDNLRSLSFVLIAVVAVFILSLFTDYGGKGGWLARESSDWAAKVGGRTIRTRDFLNAARNLDNYYRSLLGDAYDRQKSRLNLGQTAINQLVQEELVLANARDLGLTVTPEEISAEIIHDPSLQVNGAFIGVEQYKTLLRRSGIDVARYEEEVGQRILRRKWMDVVTAAISVPEADVTREIRRRGESADVDFAVFPAQDFAEQVQVPDADRRAYYQAHLSAYERGEGRTFDLVTFDRLREQRNVKVTDEEIRAEYETSMQSRYTIPEQRRASHILFKTPEGATEDAHTAARQKAAAALERVRGGEDFAKVAREVSEDTSASNGGDLGYFQKGVMAIPFEQAVWGLKAAGDLSGVVQTQFGYHVIRLTGIQPPRVKPLEEVREEITNDLGFKKSGDVVRDQAQSFATVVAAKPDSFREEAARRSLVRSETPVVRPGDPLPGLGSNPEIERAIFALKPGEVSPAVPMARGYIVARCLETRPAGAAPFEEVADRVTSDLRNERARQIAERLARQAAADPKGRPLKDLGVALGFKVQEARGAARGIGIGTLGVQPVVEDAVFSAPIGRVSGPVEADTGPVLIQVLSRKVITDKDIADQAGAVRDQMLGEQRQQLAASVTRELAKSADVQYNTTLIAQVDGAAPASAPVSPTP